MTPDPVPLLVSLLALTVALGIRWWHRHRISRRLR